MEQTPTPGQHIPTWDEIMTMIYETRRITRENAEDFDRRMKEAEQARLKNQEEYELLKKEGERVRQKSQEDFDRRMKESDEKFEKSLQKSREDFDRSLQASREDFDRRMKEEEQARLKSREDFDRRMKEEEQARLKSREDFDRRMKEEEKARQKYREEYERESKKTDKIIRKMSENFISQSGHIVEGLMEPCAMKIFQDYGFDLDKCWYFHTMSPCTAQRQGHCIISTMYRRNWTRPMNGISTGRRGNSISIRRRTTICSSFPLPIHRCFPARGPSI